jgi:hypothetical protein
MEGGKRISKREGRRESLGREKNSRPMERGLTFS